MRFESKDGARGHSGATWVVALAAALVAGAAGGAEASWPASPEGQVAKGWVEAFAAGEPAMRKFLSENVTAASFAARSLDERITGYRKLREQLGSLTLARVIEERPGALDVGLTDAHGIEQEFTFEVELVESGEDDGRVEGKLRAISARVRQGHSLFPH